MCSLMPQTFQIAHFSFVTYCVLKHILKILLLFYLPEIEAGFMSVSLKNNDA